MNSLSRQLAKTVADKSGPPRVSVLLPCYNASEYVAEAVQSILSQTFADFELIIIDDGSIDPTAEVVARFSDPRIRFLRQKNLGLAPTLNRALELATGEFLARMDADDVAHPERLQKQVNFLDMNPEVGLVGTWARILEGQRLSDRRHEPPEQSPLLKFDLLFTNSIVHSSVMIRGQVLHQAGYYSADPQRQPQDYELWSRIMRLTEVANIAEYLLTYREIPTSISRTRREALTPQLKRLIAENLAWAGNLKKADALSVAALAFGDCMSSDSNLDAKGIVDLFNRIFARFAGANAEVNREMQRRCRMRRDSILFQYFICHYGPLAGRVVRFLDRQLRKIREIGGQAA